MSWWLAAGGVAALGAASVLLPALVGGAWSPTPLPIVRRMLDLADLRPGETLYDLGAGDGRMIIAAARERGARAVGIEIDPIRYALCRARIARLGLGDRCRVERTNFFAVDLSGADVVTFYLSQAAADRLAAKLGAELRPGARVVSLRRHVPGWSPVAADERVGIRVYRPNG